MYAPTDWAGRRAGHLCHRHPSNRPLYKPCFESFQAPGQVPPRTMLNSTRPSPWTVTHDATTLGGNSGSLVVCSGRSMIAAALHYGGAAQVENWGHILSQTLSTKDGRGKTLGEVFDEFRVELITKPTEIT